MRNELQVLARRVSRVACRSAGRIMIDKVSIARNGEVRFAS